jgi:hypothetical protein
MNTPADLVNKEIGQLFVYYTVKLIKPKIFSGRGSAISVYKQYANSTDHNSVFGTLSAGSANNAMVAAMNTLPMIYEKTFQNATWTFPAYASGRFRVRLVVQGTALDSGGADFGAITTSGDSVTICNLYPGDSNGNPFTTVYKTEDGVGTNATQIVVADFEVDVRPQTGADVNSFTIPVSFAGDGPVRSSVHIEEVNDLGYEANELPQLVGIIDPTVVKTFN